MRPISLFRRRSAWLLSVALLGSAAASAPKLSFRPGASINVGEHFAGALAVAVGDVNHDGKPDQVIATDNEIVLVPGSGTANPEPGRAIFTGQVFANVALADFDRDGALDIAAICPTDGVVMIFRGHGDGSFTPSATVTIEPSNARGLTAADLNRDGRVDLAAAQQSSIAIFLGDGAGGFNLAGQLQAGESPRNITTADCNGDDVPDLAAAVNPADYIAVFLGIGGGQFLPQRRVSAGERPYGIAAGDFNRDGKTDLGVAAYTGLRVLLGDGSGGFQLVSSLDWDALPLSIAAADLNGDGAPDLVLGNYYGGEISVVLNNGDGSFRKARSVQALGDIPCVVLADVNGDSKPDVVAASFSSSTAMVAAGRGDGTFDPPVYLGWLDGSRLGPFDRSGPAAGLVVLNPSRKSVWYVKNGSADARRIAFDDYPVAVAEADFDRDGKTDLAVVTLHTFTAVAGEDMGASIRVLPGRGDGSFAPAIVTAVARTPGNYRGEVTLTAAAGDFNSDGIADIAIGNNPLGALQVFTGRTGGEFGIALENAADTIVTLASGDFNGDGIQDIAVIEQQTPMSAGVLKLYFGGTTGIREAAQSVTCADPIYAAPGRFNRDAGLDLAMSCRPSYVNHNSAVVNTWLNDSGALQAPQPVAVDLTAGAHMPIAVADFTGDGNDDLAVVQGYLTGSGTGSFGAVLVSDGSGTLRTAAVLTQLANPVAVSAPDWDGDGKPDIAILGAGDGAISVLLNQGSAGAPAILTTVNAASFFTGAVAPDSIATGFGEGLAEFSEGASEQPLPLELAGASLELLDQGGQSRNVPLFFMSLNQVNYLVPQGLSAGTAAVTVTRVGTAVAQGLITIDAVSPAVFTANSDGKGVPAGSAIHASAGGAQTSQNLYVCDADGAHCSPAPIDLGAESDQVFLTLYGTGMRGCSSATAQIGGVPATVTSIGPQPEYAGLDQVNVLVPRQLTGRGLVDVTLDVCGRTSNPVQISIR